MVAVAENTADELARSDGREVQLEEDPDLQLPFLLPEDGYSCDVVRNIPNGFQEFLDPLCQRGTCIEERRKKTRLSSIPGMSHWLCSVIGSQSEAELARVCSVGSGM